jgi:hypothetical protein
MRGMSRPGRSARLTREKRHCVEVEICSRRVKGREEVFFALLCLTIEGLLYRQYCWGIVVDVDVDVEVEGGDYIVCSLVG